MLRDQLGAFGVKWVLGGCQVGASWGPSINCVPSIRCPGGSLILFTYGINFGAFGGQVGVLGGSR